MSIIPGTGATGNVSSRIVRQLRTPRAARAVAWIRHQAEHQHCR